MHAIMSRRPGWRTSLVLLLVVAAIGAAGCAEEPAAPSETPQGQLRAHLAGRPVPEKVRLSKRYLGASAYRYFFGQRTGRKSLAAPRFPGGRGGARPADLADVLVNDRSEIGIGQSEVSIAARGGTIVAGWNDATGFYIFEEGVTGWGLSTNGGKSFRDGGGLPRIPTPGFFHLGDPGLAADNGGTFHFSDLCLDFGTDPVLSGICVTTGRRQGQTIAWRTPVYAASTLPDFLDKPLIAVDPQGDDVYVSYTRFFGGGGFGQIELVASHDGGLTFGAPVVIQPETPGTVHQGSEPAVGPNGEVYVTWERDWLTSPTPDIVISRSLNGGATFSPPVVVRTITSIAFTPPPGYNRDAINDFPRIAVAQTGPHRGDVYVTFHDAVAGSADAYLSRSSNGTSWSAPVQVNDDATDYQFWPVVAVEPGGNVDVMWYDRRLDPGTAITNTFWSQSVNGGRSFRPNVRLSDAGSDWAATVSDIIPNFGDYNDIATGGNRTYAAWGDGRLGDPDVFFSELRGIGKAKQPLASAR
ncbi:MAG: hypothetical protein H0V43_13570 [Gemmatimonadales bacterium]|nr:hypothetical protein [Gemmatimonadales bacterium]